MAIRLLFLALLGASSAPADPYLEGSAKAFLDQLSRIDSLLTQPTGCPEFDDQNRPSCNSITDGLCTKLWAEGNEGNLKVHDGELKLGWTKAGALREYRKEDYLALIASLPRLPDDLKAKAEPILQELEAHLKEEKDTTAWLRTLADIDRKFDRAVEDVELERWKQRFPEIFKKKSSERTVEERFERTKLSTQLKDEILEAKYKSHPNWARVEKVFGKVQKGLIREIEAMNISRARREEMKEKVRTAKLSLPYTSPLKLGSDEACGSSTKNAFYTRTRHEFTMCAGYFNAFQSDSALAFVIGHEIGHSIDPAAKGIHDCRLHSPAAKALNKLAFSPGPGMSCEEWAEARSSLLARPSTFSPKKIDELDGLYACLKDRSGLVEYKPESVLAAVERHSRQGLASYSDYDYFIRLAIASYESNGKTVENEYFLRPDRLKLQTSSSTQEGDPFRDANTAEIFTQALACQKINSKGIRDNPSPVERQALFRAAMEETYEVLQAQKADYYSYCGQACPDLVKDGLAANPNENFADWISARSAKWLLGERRGNQDHLREASALFWAFGCQEPGLLNADPGLNAAQQEASLLPHPEGRIRRVSIYNLENARLAGCRIEPNDQGFALCEP